MLGCCYFELKKIWGGHTTRALIIAIFIVNASLLIVSPFWSRDLRNPVAYKQLALQMENLPLEEQLLLIEEKYETVTAIMEINYFYKEATYVGEHFLHESYEKNQELFDKFGAAYADGDYLEYTNDIVSEYYLLSTVYNEIKQVYAYPSMLQNLIEEIGVRSNISVFNNSNSIFDVRNLEKASRDYSKLNSIEIKYYPQLGVKSFVSYRITDILCLAVVIYISTSIISIDVRKSLLVLIRSTKYGRFPLSLAKIGALFFSILVVTVGTNLFNMLYYISLYGFGDGDRSIQSLPFLSECTLSLSVTQYLTAHFALKILFFFVTGLFTLVLVYLFRHPSACYLFLLIWGFVGYLLWIFIPSYSHFGWIKCTTLYGAFQIGQLLSVYTNMNLCGYPINRLFLTTIFMIVSLIVLSISFSILFCKVHFDFKKRDHIFPPSEKLTTRISAFFSTINKAEFTKIIIKDKVYLILFAVVGCLVFIGVYYQKPLNISELYYKNYMQKLEGLFTQEKYDWLQEKYEYFRPVVELEWKINNNLINREDYRNSKRQIEYMIPEYTVYQQVLAHNFNYVKRNENAELIYERGLCDILDSTNKSGKISYLVISSLIVLSVSNIYGIDKSTMMVRLIASTPVGLSHTIKSKTKVAIFISCIIVLLITILRYWIALKAYGLPNVFARCISLELYNKWGDLPIIALLFVQFSAMIVTGIMIGISVSYISFFTGHFLATIVLSSLLFLIPTILSLIISSHFIWFTLFPVFDYINSARNYLEHIYSIVQLFLSMLLLYLGSDVVNEKYKKSTASF